MTFETELLPHQRKAIDKIGGLRVGALFMDMGTGKTRTVLEYVDKKAAGLVLWLCPVSTIPNLLRDIEKHCAFECAKVDEWSGERICVCGLESIAQSDRTYLKAVKLLAEYPGRAMVVVDESHMIKNPKAIRTGRSTDLAHMAHYRLVMTGTPTPQGAWDLYSQMNALDSRILGYSSWYSFAANHVEYSTKFPGMIERALNPDRIAEKIAPYTFQVTKEECLDLPPKTYSTREICVEDDVREAYEQQKEAMFDDMNKAALDDPSAMSYVIFKHLGALHKIASSSKWRAEEVASVVDGIDTTTRRVVVWHRYKSDIELLSCAIGDRACFFNGETRSKDRERAIAAFECGDRPVLVANIGCGSTGLNLQAANYAVYFNHTFDYARRMQSEDRVHRLGQSRPVHIIDVLSGLGIDSKIWKCMQRKEGLSASIKRAIKDATALEKMRREL